VDSWYSVEAVRQSKTRINSTGFSFAMSQSSLLAPDPAWLDVIASHQPTPVRKGAAERPGTIEHTRKRTWGAIAEWMQNTVRSTLGAEWTARPHNWQNSGHLSSFYWARIYPEIGDFRDLFNVGIQFSHRLKWVDELEGRNAMLSSRPVIGIWVTTNDNTIAALSRSDPFRMTQYSAIYRKHMDIALRELHTAADPGEFQVRWYRPHPDRPKERISRLVDAERFRGLVSEGSIDFAASTPGLWGPLLPMEQAIADPTTVTRLIARYLPPFASVLHATYSEMART